MIDSIATKTGASIRKVCATLGLARSSFYHAASPSPTQVADSTIGDLLVSIFHHHRRRYGYRRLAAELAERDIVCAASRIRRIMAQRGLHAIAPKSFIPKTSDGRADAPSPNLLLNAPAPTAPDQVWASDLTYIPTSKGWRYLAVIIDLYSRRIVGWSLADHLRAELILAAFQQAIQTRRPKQGAIFHSDRGSQYSAAAFRSALTKAGFRQSMSARSNPYHNAWSESFFSTLKREMLQGGCFENDSDALLELFSFIEGYYNTHRKHSSLGYQSPSLFESLFQSKH